MRRKGGNREKREGGWFGEKRNVVIVLIKRRQGRNVLDPIMTGSLEEASGRSLEVWKAGRKQKRRDRKSMMSVRDVVSWMIKTENERGSLTDMDSSGTKENCLRSRYVTPDLSS